MKYLYKKYFLLAVTSLIGTACLHAEKPLSFTPNVRNEGPSLIIHNRPLVKAHGKTISLFDVLKKMDLFAYEYDPKILESDLLRYKFYMSNWQGTLHELINNEYILADAEKKEIKASDGDIREELHLRFGPNIMKNLDKINLSYEEAKEVVETDLIMRQMLWMKVHSKTFQMVTPEEIRLSYADYLKKNPPEEKWCYQVLALRGDDNELKTAASSISLALGKQFKALTEVTDSLIENKELKVSLSEDFSVNVEKISSLHKNVLQTLKIGQFSKPTPQVSRSTNKTVYRVFHLKDIVKTEAKPLSEVYENLKNGLLQKFGNEQHGVYINQLRKHYNFDKTCIQFDDQYVPFELK